jgi:hypothetical protein
VIALQQTPQLREEEGPRREETEQKQEERCKIFKHLRLRKGLIISVVGPMMIQAPALLPLGGALTAFAHVISSKTLRVRDGRGLEKMDRWIIYF